MILQEVKGKLSNMVTFQNNLGTEIGLFLPQLSLVFLLGYMIIKEITGENYRGAPWNIRSDS